MTTNAGSEKSSANVGFVGTEGGITEARTEKALSSFLRPEFINRVDEIVVFKSLTRENFKSIARIMLNDLGGVLAEKGISFEYTDDVAALVAEKSYSVKYGARNMRRFIQREIEDRLAEIMISDYDRKISRVTVAVAEGKFEISAE